jgi:hypothetical protein
MRDDLDSAVSASLNRKARAVRAMPVAIANIEQRAGRLRRRRQRRRLLLGATIVVVATALAAPGVYLSQRPDSAHVNVLGPPTGAPASLGLRDLVDTTNGHTCPSIRQVQPTPQTTIIAGMQPTANGDHLLVPTSLHRGYCATMPYLTLPFEVDYPFTVLATCSRCATPSESVAISTSSARDTWTAQTSRGELTGVIDGRPYGYKPQTTPGGRGMLAWPKNVTFGQAPKTSFLLIGHGLTKTQYLRLADRLAQSKSAALPGLRTVYEGSADEFDYLSSDVNRSVTMGWVAKDGRQMVTYSYQHTTQPVTLAAYAWQFSDPRVAETSLGPILYGLDPDGSGHVYNYLLATKEADIAIQYVSTALGPPPRFLLSMLQHLHGISTGSTTWKTFTNLASRHTTQPLDSLTKHNGLGGTFSYANP